MEPPKIVLEQKPLQQQAALTDDELSRLWKAAISDDDTLVNTAIHELRDTHASLRDGVFLF